MIISIELSIVLLLFQNNKKFCIFNIKKSKIKEKLPC